jgi:hypothetical protein
MNASTRDPALDRLFLHPAMGKPLDYGFLNMIRNRIGRSEDDPGAVSTLNK